MGRTLRSTSRNKNTEFFKTLREKDKPPDKNDDHIIAKENLNTPYKKRSVLGDKTNNSQIISGSSKYPEVVLHMDETTSVLSDNTKQPRKVLSGRRSNLKEIENSLNTVDNGVQSSEKVSPKRVYSKVRRDTFINRNMPVEEKLAQYDFEVDENECEENGKKKKKIKRKRKIKSPDYHPKLKTRKQFPNVRIGMELKRGVKKVFCETNTELNVASNKNTDCIKCDSTDKNSALTNSSPCLPETVKHSMHMNKPFKISECNNTFQASQERNLDKIPTGRQTRASTNSPLAFRNQRRDIENVSSTKKLDCITCDSTEKNNELTNNSIYLSESLKDSTLTSPPFKVLKRSDTRQSNQERNLDFISKCEGRQTRASTNSPLAFRSQTRGTENILSPLTRPKGASIRRVRIGQLDEEAAEIEDSTNKNKVSLSVCEQTPTRPSLQERSFSENCSESQPFPEDDDRSNVDGEHKSISMAQPSQNFPSNSDVHARSLLSNRASSVNVSSVSNYDGHFNQSSFNTSTSHLKTYSKPLFQVRRFCNQSDNNLSEKWNVDNCFGFEEEPEETEKFISWPTFPIRNRPVSPICSTPLPTIRKKESHLTSFFKKQLESSSKRLAKSDSCREKPVHDTTPAKSDSCREKPVHDTTPAKSDSCREKSVYDTTPAKSNSCREKFVHDITPTVASPLPRRVRTRANAVKSNESQATRVACAEIRTTDSPTLDKESNPLMKSCAPYSNPAKQSTLDSFASCYTSPNKQSPSQNESPLLFKETEDKTPIHFKEPPRRSYIRLVRRKMKPLGDEWIEVDSETEEEPHDLHKTRTKMTKKRKQDKEEEKEANKWAETFNHQCEEIEDFELCVE